MRPEGAQVAQPRRIVGERRRLQLLRQALVGEPVELEGEEQQVGRDDVDLLLHRLEELADRRIGHVAGVDQLGIAEDAAEPLLLALVIGDRRAQRVPVERIEPSLVARGEGRGGVGGGGKVGGQLRRIAAGIEIGQVPFRQAILGPRRGGGIVRCGWRAVRHRQLLFQGGGGWVAGWPRASHSDISSRPARAKTTRADGVADDG